MIQTQPAWTAIGSRTPSAVEVIPPACRRERERLAVLEAQIAQTCYELSRLRAEHRRISGRLSLLEAAVADSSSTPANPD